MQLNPYLLFNGQCEEAFKFYEKLLGGKIEAITTHEETPAANSVPAEWRKKIIHARMTVAGQLLMGSDMASEHPEKPQGFSINISVNDPGEGKRIFDALAENGTVKMPYGETFWAKGFGMLDDRFGIPWMVNCEKAVEKAA
jgi:PhnB protein